MKINCFIIDDEPLARKGLKEYIADTSFLLLAGEFDNPLSAAGELGESKTDLLFLDIQMPKITGLDFFKTLSQPPPVIFTTAYPQYALDGFNLNALDYLVKPISFERFYQAALKAKEYYDLRLKNREVDTSATYFFIKSDGRLVKIFFDDILLVEAVQNYVNIYTSEKKWMTYLTFRSVEEYLPPQHFIKTHKSYIVPVQKIESIEGNEIKVGSHLVPISRNLKDEVFEKLLGNRFLKR
jgi:DNA-binding LytR/AlgR family response regulator